MENVDHGDNFFGLLDGDNPLMVTIWASWWQLKLRTVWFNISIKSKFDVEILPVFTSTKIGDFFSLKSKTPVPFASNVVYKFSCLRDAGHSYIGQTKRHLMTRVHEHVALSSSKSEIKTHIKNCPVCFNKKLDVNNFQILKQCKNSFNTRISEALCIRQFRPKMNKQLLTKGTSYFLKVF